MIPNSFLFIVVVEGKLNREKINNKSYIIVPTHRSQKNIYDPEIIHLKN